MPLLNISLRAGKSDAYRQAIFDSLYRAMREALNVPEDDQFMTMSEHGAANFRYGASYLDVARSDDLVYVQIIVFTTRTTDEKKAFYRRATDLLVENPGLRPEDVFINIVEAAKENWSLGYGKASFV